MKTSPLVALALGLGSVVGLAAGLSLPRAQAASPTAAGAAPPTSLVQVRQEVQMAQLEARVSALEQQETYLRQEVEGEQVALTNIIRSQGAQGPREFPTLPPARIWPAAR